MDLSVTRFRNLLIAARSLSTEDCELGEIYLSYRVAGRATVRQFSSRRELKMSEQQKSKNVHPFATTDAAITGIHLARTLEKE